MRTRSQTTQRRAISVPLAASLMAVAWVLAGCSASEGSASDEFTTEGGSDMAYEDVAGSEAMEEAGPAEDGDGAQPASDGRSVIVTGTLYMTVEDPVAAAQRATAIVRDAGGRIDAHSETAPDDYDGGSAWLVLRIPSADLDATVDDLRGLGAVDEYSTNSRDVTTEVTDLDAKISTLRASTQRIQSLLLDAEEIKDIITLEDELDGRQAELESLEARQRGLDDQVSLSSIELSLTTEPVVMVNEAPQSFWDGLTSGWNALVTFLSGALVTLGVLLPWIALAGLILLAVVIVLRVAKSRKKQRATAVTPAPASDSTEPSAS